MKRVRKDRSGQMYMRNEDLTVANFLEQYRIGFRDGYKEAQDDFSDFGERILGVSADKLSKVSKPKRKVKQSPKQKLLTKMTKVKWDKYKKGSGKKTYVEIRGEVSRSQKYKKACKRL